MDVGPRRRNPEGVDALQRFPVADRPIGGIDVPKPALFRTEPTDPGSHAAGDGKRCTVGDLVRAEKVRVQ